MHPTPDTRRAGAEWLCICRCSARYVLLKGLNSDFQNQNPPLNTQCMTHGELQICH
jgi:hypothetical protein